MLAGTPVGTADFVAAHAHAAADAACASIDRLMDVPLPAQDKFILLRSSKQWRPAHLPRAVPWELVSAAVGRLQTRTPLQPAPSPSTHSRMPSWLPS